MIKFFAASTAALKQRETANEHELTRTQDMRVASHLKLFVRMIWSRYK